MLTPIAVLLVFYGKYTETLNKTTHNIPQMADKYTRLIVVLHKIILSLNSGLKTI